MAKVKKGEDTRTQHIPDPKILKEQIICGICKKQYVNPKTLHCLHSFCVSCLQSICATESSIAKVQCPECKKETQIQSNDCEELQDAFYINRQMKLYAFLMKVHGRIETNCEKCSNKSVKAHSFCQDCGKFICELCVTIHRSWSEFEGHTVVSLLQLKSSYEKYIPEKVEVTTCPVHSKECTVYCETCEEQVCHECIIKSHRDHQYALTDDSAKKHRARMLQRLEGVKPIPDQLEDAIGKLEEICHSFSSKSKTVTSQINSEFEAVEKTLACRHKELLGEISDLTEMKLQLLNNQKRSLENVKSKALSCIEFVSHTTFNNHISEYFLLEHQMAGRIEEVKKEFTGLNLTPVEEPEAHFSMDPQVTRCLKAAGSVSEGSILYAGTDDSRCFEVDEVVTFRIALSSMYYKSQNNPSEELKAEIQSFRDGSICPAMVAVSSSGFAVLQCSFAERGRYAVIVKVSGHQITGSPYEFFVRPPKMQFQAPVRALTKLNSSKGVTVNGKNQIVISEENCHTISVYGKKAKKVLSFGTLGEAEGQLNQPTGVTVDEDGHIYVADSKNNRVQKFDSDGNFSCAFNGEKSPCGMLSAPTAVKLDATGKVFVVDRGNNRILILTSDLKYVSMFGSPQNGMGQLQDPWDLAFDKNGFVYVTDMTQHCIQIYNRSGDFRGRIGSVGTQQGRLNRPSGIAIDQFDKIYVCEFGNHRVSIFHTSNVFLDCFSTGLSMVNPCGIAVDSDGFVYVSSTELVHVF